jgi:RecA/RadA recombinase
VSAREEATHIMEDNKSKALAAALAQIEKQFGKGSIMRMDSQAAPDVQVVSTGSLGLDIALGVGGLPRGRVVEVYGPESSGRSRKRAVRQPTSMPRTRSIRSTPPSSA